MVPTSTQAEIAIQSAAAAAIVSSANLANVAGADDVDTSQKFVVHPHVATVAVDDPLLVGYLQRIYAGRRPLPTDYPSSPAFKKLLRPASVATATRTLAEELAVEMSRKNAKAGILFGFVLKLGDGTRAHGVIKADLDDEQRFHFVVAPGGAWKLGEVRDILPPPRAEFAKFAIAPQPNGTQPAGIRDLTENEAAAEYLLLTLGLRVPKTRGTQAAVAQLALRAGYSHREIRTKLDALTASAPIDEFVKEQFPDVPAQRADRLLGSDVRPMAAVQANDPYVRVYKTASPFFELRVDRTVEVDVQGSVITVTLPPGSEPVREEARP